MEAIIPAVPLGLVMDELRTAHRLDHGHQLAIAQSTRKPRQPRQTITIRRHRPTRETATRLIERCKGPPSSLEDARINHPPEALPHHTFLLARP